MQRLIILLFSLVATVGLVICVASPARAQSGGDSDDISLYVGSMLPNQIEGVREILPVFGGRYGLGTTAGTFEFGGANTHAEGVDFTTLEASWRGLLPIGDGVDGLIYGGLDLNWYIPEGSDSRRSETGVHLGAGAVMKISDTLSIRTDLKFLGGPGTALYLLFGLQFKGLTGT